MPIPLNSINETKDTEVNPSTKIAIEDNESLRAIHSIISKIQEIFMKDASVDKNLFIQFKTNIQALESYGMSIEELLQVPNLEKNILIWQELMDGNIGNLYRLTYLPPYIVQTLVHSNTSSFLNLIGRLTNISTEIAHILARYEGDELPLAHLNQISKEVAKTLATFKGNALSLSGLENISPEIAIELATFEGQDLHLNGLTNIDLDIARALASFKGECLGLRNIKAITDDVSQVLAGFSGTDIWLGLNKISNEVGFALARYPGCLTLYSLKSMNISVAQSLSKHTGIVRLCSDIKVSEKVTDLLQNGNKEFIFITR